MLQKLIELLEEIKKDRRPQDYKIVFSDNDIKKDFKFDKITKLDSLNIFMEKDGEKFNIPIHRIKGIKKDDRLIWMR